MRDRLIPADWPDCPVCAAAELAHLAPPGPVRHRGRGRPRDPREGDARQRALGRLALRYPAEFLALLSDELDGT